MEKETIFERFNVWATNSVTLKLLTMGFLVLILLIPQSMIRQVIYERENTQSSANYEIASKWGESQTIGGPVMTLPFNEYFKNDNGEIKSSVSYAHFLPEALNVDVKLEPQIRTRGIYEIVVYSAKITVNGYFLFPAIDALEIDANDVMWDKSFVSFGISDMKGISENPDFKFAENNISLNPGIEVNHVFNSGMSQKIAINNSSLKLDKYDFSMDLNINGSSNLYFLPLGKETNVTMASTWSNPSFDGSFLPDEREVREDGFDAKWKVLHINRNYPQQWINQNYSIDQGQPEEMYGESYGRPIEKVIDSAAYEFGVKLLMPVDIYQKNIRSIKYGVMAIFLTFLAFFFAEIFDKKRIHPIQYLLIGFAVCIFYLLLISMSEHISFDLSYLISTVAIVSLISSYSLSVFKNKMQSIALAAALLVIYGFFYTLLQLQDYALLIGTIGLFVILALCMYTSRKVDWYNVRGG